MNNVQNNDEQIPVEGMTQEVWLAPWEQDEKCVALRARWDALTPEEKAAEDAAEDAEIAARDAAEALDGLDGDRTFIRNPGSAVGWLIEYAQMNGHGDDDILAPLNAYVQALAALAATEGPAADAVQKLVEMAGLEVKASRT